VSSEHGREVVKSRRNEETENVCYAIYRWDFSLMNQLTCANLIAKVSVTFMKPIQDISFGQQTVQFNWCYLWHADPLLGTATARSRLANSDR
jgi:hypothetical protein